MIIIACGHPRQELVKRTYRYHQFMHIVIMSANLKYALLVLSNKQQMHRYILHVCDRRAAHAPPVQQRYSSIQEIPHTMVHHGYCLCCLVCLWAIHVHGGGRASTIPFNSFEKSGTGGAILYARMWTGDCQTWGICARTDLGKLDVRLAGFLEQFLGSFSKISHFCSSALYGLRWYLTEISAQLCCKGGWAEHRKK